MALFDQKPPGSPNGSSPPSLSVGGRWSWILLLALLFLFQAVGATIGLLSSPKQEGGWYDSLQKSPLTPPDATFGIVWSILYALLALSAWGFFERWRKSGFGRKEQFPLLVFAAHMGLNWLWSPLFFTLQAVFLSYAVILLLILSGSWLGWQQLRSSRSWLLVYFPYISWLSFASYLNLYIGINN